MTTRRAKASMSPPVTVVVLPDPTPEHGGKVGHELQHVDVRAVPYDRRGGQLVEAGERRRRWCSLGDDVDVAGDGMDEQAFGVVAIGVRACGLGGIGRIGYSKRIESKAVVRLIGEPFGIDRGLDESMNALAGSIAGRVVAAVEDVNRVAGPRRDVLPVGVARAGKGDPAHAAGRARGDVRRWKPESPDRG